MVEYKSTWYYKFVWFGGSLKEGERWISGRPIRVFGFHIGNLWKIAKDNYPWQD